MSHSALPPSHSSLWQTLRFYTTAPYACSYLPDRQARSQIASPAHAVSAPVYAELIRYGFRRSGMYAYRPHCDHCSACLPLRVRTLDFQPGRTLRRTQQGHASLMTEILPLQDNDEHFTLYQRYLENRHPTADMDHGDRQQYHEFLAQSRVNSSMVTFRRPNDQALQMVTVIDRVADGLSAVYTFYDPQAEGSLGTYAILWLIETCRQQHLPYLYLGYWIEASQKMAYKSKFKPFEVLVEGEWQLAAPQ